MLQLIRDWLNGPRNYEEGLFLLRQIEGGTPLLEMMEDVGENKRNTLRLLNKLKEAYTAEREKAPAPIVQSSDRIAQEPEKVAPNAKNVAQNAKSVAQNAKNVTKLEEKEPDYSTSEIYLSAKKQANIAYKELMNKRAMLFRLTQTAENWDNVNQPDLVAARSRPAVEIVREYRILSELYDKAEFVRVHGRLPAEELTAETEYAALPDYLVKPTINKLRNNINKMKKRDATPERIALIEKHSANLKILEERWRSLTPGT